MLKITLVTGITTFRSFKDPYYPSEFETLWNLSFRPRPGQPRRSSLWPPSRSLARRGWSLSIVTRPQWSALVRHDQWSQVSLFFIWYLPSPSKSKTLNDLAMSSSIFLPWFTSSSINSSKSIPPSWLVLSTLRIMDWSSLSDGLNPCFLNT